MTSLDAKFNKYMVYHVKTSGNFEVADTLIQTKLKCFKAFHIRV